MTSWPMQGRACLVTGASSGIGFETSAALAAMGARVVLASRSRRRLDAAARTITRRHAGADLDVMVVDLSSQAAIRQFAADVAARHPALHVLVNNAAVVTRRREVTVDGFERQWAVNHLAPFLLTHLLLPILQASAPARIVTVASQVERDGDIPFDDLQGERHYHFYAAYRQSKLANILFTFELARRIQGTGVTANCLHPGVVGTNLVHALADRPGFTSFLTRRSLTPAAEATGTILRLAGDPQLSGASGGYFREEKQSEPSARARDEALARRLWEVSARQVGLATQ